MPDYTPVYGRPETLTYTAGAAITGGDLLQFFGGPDQVVQTQFNCGNFAGVAAHDAVAGQLDTVYAGAGVIHETKALAATAAGAPVYASSGAGLGASNSGYNVPVGVAVRSTSGSNQLLRWKSLVG